MWHRHIWKVVKEETHPSAWDQIVDKEAAVTNLQLRHQPSFTRPVIVTYRCEKCGTEKVQRV